MSGQTRQWPRHQNATRKRCWENLPTVEIPSANGPVSAADIMRALPEDVQDYLASFGDNWDDIPMPAIMEKHHKISGALVLQHLHHTQELMVRAVEGEQEFDDDIYQAITNFAAEGIFHLRAVLLLMMVLEHGWRDE